MLSFSKVITFAAVAFGTLSQAIPLTPREVGIGARASGPVQLKGLLTDLKMQLVTAVAPINSLTTNNATAPFVLPILEDINGILSDAANLVEDLVAEPVDELLEDVDDVLLTADDVFCLVRDVLTTVFEALEIVSQLIADLSELLEILPILVNTITVLLGNIIKITAVAFGNALVVKIQAFVAGSLIVGVLSNLHLSLISL